MRYATWKFIESQPVLHGAYRAYRTLPASVRSPLRLLASPLRSLVVSLIMSRSAERVVSGPFRGLALDLAPVSRRHLLSYVLGTTELELIDVIERIVARRYETFLNIGAADGYYAVGLAMRSPGARVIAFEAQTQLHAGLARVALKNGVSDRVEIQGICTEEALRARLDEAKGATLIFMDIEGAERELLDPEQVASLASADILVETHDTYAPRCTAALIERFSATHDVERYRARPRTLGDFPAGFLSWIPRFLPDLAVDLMDERRDGPQDWLFMVARQSGSKASVSR